MIIRELSPIPYNEGKLTVAERAKAIMKFGSSWPAEMKSQDAIGHRLGRTLDNSHTLLKNVRIPAADIIVPLILVSPKGLTVIYNSPVKGVFRAQGTSWNVLGGVGKFQAARPNLIRRTQLITRATEIFLQQQGHEELAVDGVLMLTNPGSHVDAPRPAVRIVQLDALDRFANEISKISPTLSREQRFKLVELFIATSEEIDEAEEEAEQAPKSSAIDDLSKRIDSSFTESVSPLQKRFNFSRKQWLVLGAIVIAEVLILVGFLVLILFTA